MNKACQAFESARMLLDAGDTDGATNRAYYAMFDAARAALVSAGFEIGKTHKGVLATFSDRLVRDGPFPKEFGRLLKHAEAFRYVADYAGDRVELGDAEDIVAQAESFLAAVRAFGVRTDGNSENTPD